MLFPGRRNKWNQHLLQHRPRRFCFTEPNKSSKTWFVRTDLIGGLQECLLEQPMGRGVTSHGKHHIPSGTELINIRFKIIINATFSSRCQKKITGSGIALICCRIISQLTCHYTVSLSSVSYIYDIICLLSVWNCV